MGMKFGTEEGPLLRAKFHPHRCNMSPLRGEKPQNRPLSKLNTGRFALRAMLPVTSLYLKLYKPKLYKSPAVAEMGDRLATIDMARNVGLLCPFSWREVGLHLIQRHLDLGLPPYQVAS